MADKALVALRGAALDPAAVVSVRTDATAVGCSVEQILPTALLVRGTLTQFAELVQRGYWVRVLRDTNVLRVGKYVIDITTTPPHVPPDLEVPTANLSDWPHHLIQLIAPATQAWTTAIQATGAAIITRVPEYGLAIRATSAQLHQIEAMTFVAWRGPFKPAYRMALSLDGASGIVRDLVVLTHPRASLDEAVTRIETLGGTVLSKGSRGEFGRVVATLAAHQVNVIATLPNVFRLEQVAPDVVLLDERTCQIVAGGSLVAMGMPGYHPKESFDVDGTGVSIAIVDTGVDSTHPDFIKLDGSSRFTAQEALDPGTNALSDALGHGTAVAGVAAGDPTTTTPIERDIARFALGQGMAPKASLVSLKIYKDIGDTSGFPQFLSATAGIDTWTERAIHNNAHIMNNSWETGDQLYTEVCRTIDDKVRRGPLVIVCGAGNSGPNPVIAPGVAKNVITVGASLSLRSLPAGKTIDDIWSNSRPGPSLTGRRLPTVVAPGTFIVSARAKCGAQFDEVSPSAAVVPHPNYALGGTLLNPSSSACLAGPVAGKSGTSYSAPHVAGMCALMIESWQRRTAGLTPSPALLKAWIVNGAVNVGIDANPFANIAARPHIPNNNAGWGRVSLATTLRSDGGQKLFTDQTFVFHDPGDVFTRRVTPLDPTMPLRVTLAWTDAAIDVDDQGRLAYNLDLEVLEEATGQRFLGNVNFVSGFSNPAAPSDIPDGVDNVECVYLRQPRGVYTIRVTTSSAVLPTDTQDFALVIENAEQVSDTPLSAVAIIDRSGSMSGSGYVEPARAAVKSFLDCLAGGDEGAVVSFADAASIDQNLTRIDGPVRQYAQAAVDALAFGGCTNSGDGVAAANQLLTLGTHPRKAIVFVSDGYDNQGCQSGALGPQTAIQAAAGGAAAPIHTCALGPASDQTALQALAAASGGKYYYAPTSFDLQEICSYMAAEVTGDEVLALDTFLAVTRTISVPVDTSVTSLKFQVTWEHPALTWVSKMPGIKQIQIMLFDPLGQRWNPTSCHTRLVNRPGGLMFHIDQPPAGVWKIYVRTRKKRTRCCVGVFARTPLTLQVAARSATYAVGDKIQIDASGFVSPLAKGFSAKVKGMSSRPTMTLGALAKKYRRSLKVQSVSRPLKDDGIATDIGKLLAFNRARITSTGKSIFTTATVPVKFSSRPGHIFAGSRSAPASGTYNFVVTGLVTQPGAASVIRKKMVSVLVAP
ncbi:MAG TPA: S8 family serine peptidase [Vicinamibacterales bacterium]|nr:S8 family serine peptidase [Vicinamibacterales bacterium]